MQNDQSLLDRFEIANVQPMMSNVRQLSSDFPSIVPDFQLTEQNFQPTIPEILPAAAQIQTIASNDQITLPSFQSTETDIKPTVTDIMPPTTDIQPTTSDIQLNALDFPPMVFNFQEGSSDFYANISTNELTVSRPLSIHPMVTDFQQSLSHSQPRSSTLQRKSTKLQTRPSNFQPRLSSFHPSHADLLLSASGSEQENLGKGAIKRERKKITKASKNVETFKANRSGQISVTVNNSGAKTNEQQYLRTEFDLKKLQSKDLRNIGRISNGIQHTISNSNKKPSFNTYLTIDNNNFSKTQSEFPINISREQSNKNFNNFGKNFYHKVKPNYEFQSDRKGNYTESFKISVKPITSDIEKNKFVRKVTKDCQTYYSSKSTKLDTSRIRNTTGKCFFIDFCKLTQFIKIFIHDQTFR